MWAFGFVGFILFQVQWLPCFIVSLIYYFLTHWIVQSLVHWYTDSLLHWRIESLNHWFIEFIDLSFHCFIGSLNLFTDSLIYCFIHQFIASLLRLFSCAVTLSCHFSGISTTMCSFDDAPHNFNTSLLLHRKNFPIADWFRWVMSYFWNFRPGTRPARPDMIQDYCRPKVDRWTLCSISLALLNFQFSSYWPVWNEIPRRNLYLGQE